MSKHTKNPKRYIGVIGDMDPITHGGGIVYYPEGGKAQGPWVTYFQPGEGVGDWDDADATVEIYSFPVEDDAVADMDWASWDEIAKSFDMPVSEIQMHARSTDPLARAGVYEMIGQYGGFIELDQYPETISYKAAERQWGRRVDAAHKAATKARRKEKVNPTKVQRREQTAAASSIGGAIGSAAGGPFGAALGAGAGTYAGWYYDEIVGAVLGAAKGARTARANPMDPDLEAELEHYLRKPKLSSDDVVRLLDIFEETPAKDVWHVREDVQNVLVAKCMRSDAPKRKKTMLARLLRNPKRNRSSSGWQRVDGTSNAWFNRLGSRVSLLLAKAKGARAGQSDRPYRLVVDVEGKGMVRLGTYSEPAPAMAEGDRYIQTLTSVCGQLEGQCPNPSGYDAAMSLTEELRQAVENAAEPPFFNRRDFVGLHSRAIYEDLTGMGLITLRDGVVRVTGEGQGIALAVHKMHEDIEYEPWNLNPTELLSPAEAIKRLSREGGVFAPKNIRPTNRPSGFARGTVVRVTALVTGQVAEYVVVDPRLVKWARGDALLVQRSSGKPDFIPVNRNSRIQAVGS